MYNAEAVVVFVHLPPGPIPPDEKIKGVDWLDEYLSNGCIAFEKTLHETSAETPDTDGSIEKPVVIVNGLQEADLLSKIHALLLKKNAIGPEIFRRGNKLVTLARKDEQMHLMELNYEAFKFKIINLADWVVRDKEGNESDTWIADRIVKQLFWNPPEELEVLDGIVRTPFFDNDGNLIHRSGYYKNCGVFMNSQVDLSVTPLFSEVTSREIDGAKQILDEMLSEFSFKNDSDRTHYVSALLHPVIRRMFRGPTPLMFIDASAPRSGKTLLAEMLSIVQTGNIVPGIVLSSDEDEQRKAITGLFRTGAEMFFFDNVKTGIDSSVLAKAATQDVWTDRMLGSNEIFTAKNDVPWIFTINGFSATGEIVRRSPRIRVIHQSKMNFERDAHQQKEWVRNERSRIVEALCVLVKIWVQKGRPVAKHGRQLPSFEAWSTLVGGIFDAAGIPGFLENQEEYAFTADDETSYMSAIFNHWKDKFGEILVRPTELISEAEIRSLFIEMLGNSNPHALPGAVGTKLRSWIDRVASGYQLRLPKDSGSKRGRLYQLVRTGEGGGGPTANGNGEC